MTEIVDISRAPGALGFDPEWEGGRQLGRALGVAFTTWPWAFVTWGLIAALVALVATRHLRSFGLPW